MHPTEKNVYKYKLSISSETVTGTARFKLKQTNDQKKKQRTIVNATRRKFLERSLPEKQLIPDAQTSESFFYAALQRFAPKVFFFPLRVNAFAYR